MSFQRLFLVGLLVLLPASMVAPASPTAIIPPEREGEQESSQGEQPDVPDLPPGLGTSGEGSGDADQDRRLLPEGLSGFVEARAGVRLQDDPFQRTTSIADLRAQLQGEWETGPAVFQVTADLLVDPVLDRYGVDLETGEGVVDLREAKVLLRPADVVDLQIGRQILTWGTGDLVFINDLFPKDFRSFFVGRDDEYLKAPSDAIRTSLFFDVLNVDVVYTPRFDADRFVDGSRLSYFNPMLGAIAGRNAVIEPSDLDDTFKDDEFALRLSRNVGSYELAAYGYHGFWKSPAGATPGGDFVFPELSVYGASGRGPLAGGVFNAEFGVYDSRNDRDGANPLIPNGEFRYLLGFEREAIPDLTVGLQYYAEVRADADAARAALPPSAPRFDRVRDLVTLRLTKLALNQNLTLSLFNFWSPNQGDGHLRLRASHKLTDDWLVEAGVNLFHGDDPEPFGQLEQNSNVFVAVRRSF